MVTSSPTGPPTCVCSAAGRRGRSASPPSSVRIPSGSRGRSRQHSRRAGPAARGPTSHPGPRRGPDQTVQGVRRGEPALDRLQPQPSVGATRRARGHPHRLARPHRPRRSARQSDHQNLRYRILSPAGSSATPERDPEDPPRLGLGPRHRHRLDPNPTPAPHLTVNPAAPTTGTPKPLDTAPTRALGNTTTPQPTPNRPAAVIMRPRCLHPRHE